MKRLSLLCAALSWLLTSLVLAAPGIRNGGGEDVILQGFHWNSSRTTPQTWYEILKQMAPTIGRDDFTKIWLPPAWVDAKSGTSGGGEGYFWHDFDKNSNYGSETQLKQAVDALSSAGVQAVYDVVPNHMNDNLPGTQVRFLRHLKL